MLQIRLTEAELAELRHFAAAEYLSPSAWARQHLLRLLAACRGEQEMLEDERRRSRDAEERRNERRLLREAEAQQ